jgi:hypothetical protein
MNKQEARRQAVKVAKGIIMKRAKKRARPELKAAYREIASLIK